MMTDLDYMVRALQLAQRGLYTCHPNPRVGCVVVKNGTVVGEGWHQVAGGPHAEINALKQADTAAKGATLYVSLEPCSHKGKTGPCTEAVIKAGITRVVAALLDPNPKVSGRGAQRLRDAGIEVLVGLMAEEAAQLNRGFIMRMTRGRPWVRCKLAMSLDGRTAMANGASQWITGEEARADVHRLRAQSAAIISGIGTVLADDPSFTARIEGVTDQAPFKQPWRVILDPRLSTPPLARMFSEPGRTLLVTTSQEQEIVDELTSVGAEILYQPSEQQSIDLHALMSYLAEEEINEVLVETGATLSGGFLRAGLIDELIIYMAPHLMGNDARGLFNLPELTSLDQRIPLKIKDIRPIGSDWRISAEIA